MTYLFPDIISKEALAGISAFVTTLTLSPSPFSILTVTSIFTAAIFERVRPKTIAVVVEGVV